MKYTIKKMHAPREMGDSGETWVTLDTCDSGERWVTLETGDSEETWVSLERDGCHDSGEVILERDTAA